MAAFLAQAAPDLSGTRPQDTPRLQSLAGADLKGLQNVSKMSCSRYEAQKVADPPAVYRDERLTGIDFPVGALGGSVIRMDGRGERAWWQIFNNFAQPAGSGMVPNSFFAIRTRSGDARHVRALQTSAVGPFLPMESLVFQGEYPFGWYHFEDPACRSG